MATGVPPAKTRTAPANHWPVTHGGVPLVLSAQPAIMYGEPTVTTGCPDTLTRGNGALAVACPAWEQSTAAPKWTIGPGISNHRQRAHVDVHARSDH
jgi:hypothetical protein